MFYATDYEANPLYAMYWVVQFRSRQERDTFCEGEHRAPLLSSSPAVRWARRNKEDVLKTIDMALAPDHLFSSSE